MKLKIYLLPLLFAGLFSCGENGSAKRAGAKELIDSAMNPFPGDSLSLRKSIGLLNEALQLEPDNYAAYINRCMLESGLKEYGQALLSVKQMIRLHPENADHYGTAGTLCERTGDSAMAREYYKMAHLLYDKTIADNTTGRQQKEQAQLNKGVLLIMENDTAQGNRLLRMVGQHPADSVLRMAARQFLGKTKKEILDLYQPK